MVGVLDPAGDEGDSDGQECQEEDEREEADGGDEDQRCQAAGDGSRDFVGADMVASTR